jgi:uncharacterized protein
MTLRITNATRNSILATHAQAARTPHERLTGLIGITRMQPGTGMLFPEANAIHTVNMSMIIDVLFIDTMLMRVQKAVENAEPGCHFNTIKIPRELCAVLELPAGTIQASGTKVGDGVVILASTHCSEEEQRGIASLWPHSA